MSNQISSHPVMSSETTGVELNRLSETIGDQASSERFTPPNTSSSESHSAAPVQEMDEAAVDKASPGAEVAMEMQVNQPVVWLQGLPYYIYPASIAAAQGFGTFATQHHDQTTPLPPYSAPPIAGAQTFGNFAQHDEKRKRKSKPKKRVSSESEDPSSSDDSESDSDASSSSLSALSSDDETSKKKSKQDKKKKTKRPDDSDSSYDVPSPEKSEEDVKSAKQPKSKKSKKSRTLHEEESSSDSTDSEDVVLTSFIPPWSNFDPNSAENRALGRIGVRTPCDDEVIQKRQAKEDKKKRKEKERKKKQKEKKRKEEKKRKDKKSKPDYSRVDQVWDQASNAYKLQETTSIDTEEYEKFLFIVRQLFGPEGKYLEIFVDINSGALKTVLQVVLGSNKAVSLAGKKPSIDPKLLFLHLEDLKSYYQVLIAKSKTDLMKRFRKAAKRQATELKCLIKYLDEEYATIKHTLTALLEAGTITFELLWTLFKSDTIVYTSTYSTPDEPRAFKVDYATKECSILKGSWYEVEGRYLDFDGKNFGMGKMEVPIESFKGPRKITSLPCYPIKYHKDAQAIQQKLIERGRKFTSLAGMLYKFHLGMGFVKKKRQVIKVSVNSRVMLDPATFRRINPNYPISTISPEDPDTLLEEESDSDDEEASKCRGSNDEEEAAQSRGPLEDTDQPKTRQKLIVDEKMDLHVVDVEVDEEGQEIKKESFERLAGDDETSDKKKTFTDEELLIASPVVLGFAFAEKLWLEFTVSGIQEIDWDEGAFESLVLPAEQKAIVQGLVQSHTSEIQHRKTIDDLITGKGKGLVAVLHGPPGVGKTLTAEGIAEQLKRPLYCVGAGELGTNPRELELELTNILDVAHTWGAVLLLDEADVFMEERGVQDIHRNALVSIFLRVLEYFQGILFLTTNRVGTFDKAFQSRIHFAIKYKELETPARRAIWKIFLEKVSAISGKPTTESTVLPLLAPEGETTTTSVIKKIPEPPFTEEDLDDLAKKNYLNGRQIKNCVRSAQALAVNEGVPLEMRHVLQVLRVAAEFDKEVKGGPGHEEAQNLYN